jgi:hypothetical protein
MSQTIEAHEVKVGDTLEIWWAPHRDTVVAIRPYTGRLECLKGGWIFRFALLPSKEMSVAPGDCFQRANPHLM